MPGLHFIAVDEFAAALVSAGLQLDGAPIMDSRLHRVPVDGDKRGRRSGAYIGHLEGSCPAGYIQNFKTGLAHNWKAQSGADPLMGGPAPADRDGDGESCTAGFQPRRREVSRTPVGVS